MSRSDVSRIGGRTPVMREVRGAGACAASALRVDLNTEWRFYRDEQSAASRRWLIGMATCSRSMIWTRSQVESVNLPHSVRLDPLNASGGRNFQGVCWYLRELPVRESCADASSTCTSTARCRWRTCG